MAIRSTSDAIAWFIARLPLLVIAIAIAWIAIQGLSGLERYSFGTEFFVSNDATDNVLPMPVSNEQLALDAINSGDLATMEAALDEIQARQNGAGAPVPAG